MFPAKDSMIGILLFIVGSALSLSFTPLALNGLKDFLQYNYIFLAFCPIFFTTLTDHRTRWETYLAVWVVLSGISLVGLALWTISGEEIKAYNFVYGNQNSFYWIVASTSLLSLFLLTEKVGTKTRYFAGFIFVVSGAAVLVSTTTSALLQLAIGIWIFAAWITARSSWRCATPTFVASTLIAGVLGTAFLVLNWELVYRQGSLHSRIPMYSAAFDIGFQAFPFGTGIGSSPLVLDDLPERIPRVTHNFVLHFWLEIGVIGATGFLLLIFSWFRNVTLSFIIKPHQWNAFEVGMASLFASYLAVAFFQPPPVRRFWWLSFVFGWAVVIDKTVTHSQSRPHQVT